MSLFYPLPCILGITFQNCTSLEIRWLISTVFELLTMLLGYLKPLGFVILCTSHFLPLWKSVRSRQEEHIKNSRSVYRRELYTASWLWECWNAKERKKRQERQGYKSGGAPVNLPWAAGRNRRARWTPSRWSCCVAGCPPYSGWSCCPHSHVDGARRSELLLSPCLLISHPGPCWHDVIKWQVAGESEWHYLSCPSSSNRWHMADKKASWLRTSSRWSAPSPPLANKHPLSPLDWYLNSLWQ